MAKEKGPSDLHLLSDRTATQRFVRSPSPQLREILARILDSAMKQIGVKHGWIALADPVSRTLRIIAHRGISGRHQSREIKIGEEGITGWVAKEGKPLNIPDVSKDPRYLNIIKTTRSEICVPLASTTGILGIINLESHELEAFTNHDENLLVSLADQAAIAVETVLRLEKNSLTLDKLERLQETSQSSAKYLSEPKRVLDIIAKGVCDTLEADSAVIYPYDYVRKDFYDVEFVAYHGTRFPLKLRDKPRTDGLAAWVSKTKWLVRENIPEEDPALLDSPFISREGINAFVAVCLEVEADVVGVLYVNYRAPHHFSELELRLIHTFAHQSALAIYNARRFERTNAELTRNIMELESLRRIDNTISSTLELTEVLDRILDEGMKIVNAPTGTIQLLDPNTQELEFRAGRGIREDRMTRRIKLNEGVTGLVAAKKMPMLVPDLRKYEGSFVDVMHEKSLSELAVPMIAGEEVIGVLNVESPLPHHFAERDERLFQTLAGQSVIAIQNASRYETIRRERRRFEALAKINRVIGGMQSVDEVIHALLEVMGDVLAVENRGILLYDPAKDVLVVHPSAHYKIDAEKASQAAIRVGMYDWEPGLTAWSARHRESVLVNDVGNDPRYLNLISSTRSELAVPMVLGDCVRGVLNLESDEVGHFTDDDKRLVEAIAEQAVLAIEKAEKNEIIARQQRQAALQRKWAQIGELVTTLTHRIGNDIGLIRARAEIIKTSPHLDSYILKQAEAIYARADGVVALTKQFFGKGLSRVFVEDQRTVQLDLNKVIVSAIERSFDLGRVNHSFEPWQEPLFVFADDRLLEEVFRELIANAVQATPEGGTIEISVQKVEKVAQVWIADTGKGIPAEHANVVWKPFQKLDGEGYGFGLWWAKGFVKDLGGDITHRPNERHGKGTIFTVSLPLI